MGDHGDELVVPGAALLRARFRLSCLLVSGVVGLVTVLAVMLPGQRDQIVSPGKLARVHGTMNADCASCHTSAELDPTQWVAGMVSAKHVSEDAQKCLACHQMGQSGSLAHGVPSDELAAITAAKANVDGALISPSKSHMPACATCHVEHAGEFADLTAISQQRCQGCHTQEVESFADGHPEFDSMPTARRTRIVFDHASHLLKHFQADGVAEAPTSCGSCHTPDLHGRMMLTAGFETTCASCHGDEIRSAGNVVKLLNLPGMDVASAPVGGAWSEDADAELSVFMKALLATDEKVDRALVKIGDADLFDLEDADSDMVEAVGVMAKATQALMERADHQGHAALDEIFAVLMPELPKDQRLHLARGIPVDSVRAARAEWFPEKEALQEVIPPEPSVTASSTGDEDILDGDILGDGDDILGGDDGDSLGGDEDEDILGGDDEDILGGEDEDILGGDDEDILGGDDMLLSADIAIDADAVAGGVSDPNPGLDPEIWTQHGGWFRQNFGVLYRSSGHGDELVKAWLDGSVTSTKPRLAAVLAHLRDPSVSGACTSCHSVDSPGTAEGKVNWHANKPPPERRGFTKFSHAVHLTLNQPDGCMSCHQLDESADFAMSYKQDDPMTFVSNFKAIKKEQCASCHQKGAASTSCTTCHNYHAGPNPAFPSSALP